MQIKQLETFPTGTAIKWSDETDSFIDYQTLRDKCPCASCQGESDLFGNKTQIIPVLKTGTAYNLLKVSKVGHYALQFTWGDGHNTGIYTLELLKSLGE
jgi:DUF971 family protein